MFLKKKDKGTSCYPETICSEGLVNSFNWFATNHTEEMEPCRSHRHPLLPPMLVLVDFCSQSPGDFDLLPSLGILITLGHSLPKSHSVHIPLLPPEFLLPIHFYTRLSQEKARNPAPITFWNLPSFLPKKCLSSMTQSQDKCHCYWNASDTRT